ncbi:MAG: sigma-70 family RNA polymerase sigma factor [bacterium]
MESNQTINDQELVNDVLAGNTQAFNQLVTRYFNLVYLIGYARFRRKETGEDLAQETFLRAYLHLEKLADPNLFPAWICRIARNLATDWQRRNQRVSQLLPMIPIEDLPTETPDTKTLDARAQLETSGQNKVVQEALLKLPADLREIVLLYYSEGLNKEEIGRLLGIHPVQVGRQLKKALGILKGILEPVLRESIQPLRASQKATLRTIAVIAATAAISESSKSEIISATTELTQLATKSLIQSSGSIPETLNPVSEVISQGSNLFKYKKTIAVTVIAAAIIGVIYYFQKPKETKIILKSDNKVPIVIEKPKNESKVISMVEEHDRILRNARSRDSSSQTLENPKEVPDCTGYYISGGIALMEIKRNTDASLQIIRTDFSQSYYHSVSAHYYSDSPIEVSERQSTDKCEQQGNQILYGNNSYSKGMYIIAPDGTTLDNVYTWPENKFILPKFFLKIPPEVWTAVHSYFKHEYPPAESGFRQYLQSHPNNALIQLYLADALIAQGKLDEAKVILAVVETSPEKESNWLYPILARKVKYLIAGKEKSIAKQNAWDEYQKLKHVYTWSASQFDYVTLNNIVGQNIPIGNKEMQLMQQYIEPHLDAVQDFLKLPEKKDCYTPDFDHMYALTIPDLPTAVSLYGRLKIEEGNVKEAIEIFRRITRFGQQITYGTYEQNKCTSLIRNYGENGFILLFTEGKINTLNDAELIYKTLKELRRLDPTKLQDYGFDLEQIGYFAFHSKSKFPQIIMTNIPETKLILLETAAALKLYQLQHGSYPSKIQELIPNYLSNLPKDTFNNNPIKFAPSSQGIIVYSYGPDNVDDHGLTICDVSTGYTTEKNKGDLVILVK